MVTHFSDLRTQGESTDNFNWGVRRRPLSGVGIEGELAISSQAADSLSEKTPLLTIRTVRAIIPGLSTIDVNG